MTANYTHQIEQAITLFTEAVLASEPDLRRRGVDIDGDVQQLLRKVGLGIVSHVLGAVCEQVSDEAAATGLTMQRRAEIRVDCIFGPVTVESPYLWSPGRGARPVKEVLGLRHRQRSVCVERALTDFGAEESFGMAVQRFEEHYGFSVGRTTVLRVVEQVAEETQSYVQQRLDQARELFGQPLATRPGCGQLLTELDGCEIRTGRLTRRPGRERTPVRRRKRRQRREEWREVRVGLTRRLEEIDRTYVAAMSGYPEVTEQLFCAAVDRGLSTKTTVIGVGDGGQGLREALAAKFSTLRFILDRPHLKGHLYETAEALRYTEGEARDAWVRKHMGLIDGGRVHEALSLLRDEQKRRRKPRLRQLINYLFRFQDAVHYQRYRDEGLPCGSGEVESAHRYIPQKRLKIPGACWHPDTVNPMLSLRVLRANGWWGDFWRQRGRAIAA